MVARDVSDCTAFVRGAVLSRSRTAVVADFVVRDMVAELVVFWLSLFCL